MEQITDFDVYQVEASKTAFTAPDLYLLTEMGEWVNAPYVYPALGLGEAGEVQGKIKKILRDAKGDITPETREAVMAELGDLLWYLSETARNTLGIKLSEVATYNIKKLRDRMERGTLKGNGDNR